jgi:hypothetical protein
MIELLSHVNLENIYFSTRTHAPAVQHVYSGTHLPTDNNRSTVLAYVLPVRSSALPVEALPHTHLQAAATRTRPRPRFCLASPRLKPTKICPDVSRHALALSRTQAAMQRDSGCDAGRGQRRAGRSWTSCTTWRNVTRAPASSVATHARTHGRGECFRCRRCARARARTLTPYSCGRTRAHARSPVAQARAAGAAACAPALRAQRRSPPILEGCVSLCGVRQRHTRACLLGCSALAVACRMVRPRSPAWGLAQTSGRKPEQARSLAVTHAKRADALSSFVLWSRMCGCRQLSAPRPFTHQKTTLCGRARPLHSCKHWQRASLIHRSA